MLTSKCEQLLGMQVSSVEPGHVAPASPTEECLGNEEVEGCIQKTRQDGLKSLLFWVRIMINNSGLLQSFVSYIHIFLGLDFSVFKTCLSQIQETFIEDFSAVRAGTYLLLANTYA